MKYLLIGAFLVCSYCISAQTFSLGSNVPVSKVEVAETSSRMIKGDEIYQKSDEEIAESILTGQIRPMLVGENIDLHLKFLDNPEVLRDYFLSDPDFAVKFKQYIATLNMQEYSTLEEELLRLTNLK